MKQKLDLESWNRKEHFLFFNKFEEPYYGVCVDINCTNAYEYVKQKKISFFLYYLYQALGAAQLIEPFRLRIKDDEVYVYDQINAGSTIPRSNGTFGYGYMLYYPELEDFITEANKEISKVQQSTDLVRSGKDDLIRFSSLPWINFTSLSHARSFAVKDSCPKISFGKMTEVNGVRTMPVSIHVHHALVDGIHVGQYIDCFQELMNKKL